MKAENVLENISPVETAAPSGDKSRERKVVYTPHGHLGIGLGAWREMTQELVESRELTWRLFLRDFSARYRQSVLGYIWAIVPALVTTFVFTWLNRSHVLAIEGTKLPYPVFVLLGMTVWQLFSGGLTNATQSMVGASALITKINFPRETLVIAAFGQAIFEFFHLGGAVGSGVRALSCRPGVDGNSDSGCDDSAVPADHGNRLCLRSGERCPAGHRADRDVPAHVLDVPDSGRLSGKSRLAFAAVCAESGQSVRDCRAGLDERRTPHAAVEFCDWLRHEHSDFSFGLARVSSDGTAHCGAGLT